MKKEGQAEQSSELLEGAKKRRKKLTIAGIAGGATLFGLPTFILYSEAGVFACLVGSALGFTATRVAFLFMPDQRSLSRYLRDRQRREAAPVVPQPEPQREVQSNGTTKTGCSATAKTGLSRFEAERMKLDVPLRGFSSQDEARNVALRLESEGIPCRVSTNTGGVFATLFVAAEHSDSATGIVGQDGFEIKSLIETESEQQADTKPDTNSEDLLRQVAAELDADTQKNRSPLRQLGVLALSLVLFVSLGLFSSPITGIALLAGVLLVHELGHLVGMKLLKYKDLQMFFIPFFGAAVSGTEREPSAARRAIVSLLGPVPGILIGIVTGIAYLRTRQPLLADATRTLLFINTFNLLPFHPLDGGRFLDAVLFSRHPKIEIGFKILTALALVCLAVIFKNAFLGIFAFFAFISLRGTHISASIAHSMSKRVEGVPDAASQRIPAEQIEQIVDMLRAKLPAQHQRPKLMAAYATGIWQRIRSRPCRLAPAIGLVFCYAFFLLLGIGAAFIFQATVLLSRR